MNFVVYHTVLILIYLARRLMWDIFSMRHSLTGGGITVELSDIVVVRKLLKPLQNLCDDSLECQS